MRIRSFLLHLLLLVFPAFSIADDKTVVNIGLIADMQSWEGKVVRSFVSMAVRDFYELNTGFRTRIQPRVRDSKGDSLQAIGAAVDLLENVEVQGIIVPKISNEELFMAQLADKANVPLLSFSSPSSFSQHPYVIQVGEDETDQFHGIAALIKANKWRSFVLLHDDTADARLSHTYMHDIFQENDLDMVYRAAISLQATDDQIINELHKLEMIKASVFVVHLSPSVASRVFTHAKMLGMVRKGPEWLMTSKTMNLLDPQDSSVCESMQGVLGFRPYIPASSKLQNLALRWRREFHDIESSVKIRELNVVGRWAYDAAWVLAEAIEKAGVQVRQFQNQIEASESKPLDLARMRVSSSGPSILSKIISSRFTGLVDEFNLTNGKLVQEVYEILNITCNVESPVGFWTSAHGLTKDIRLQDNLSSNTLEPSFSLRIGIPANGRFPELVGKNNDPKRGTLPFSGFCIDVFLAVLDKLPYKISPEYVSYNNGNGSYNDLVKQVYLKKIDAAIGDITILSNRSDDVDFTVPYSELGVGFMVKLHDDPWFFLKPLSTKLWIMSACSFILMGSIVWLIERRENEAFQGSVAQQIGAILWFALSTLVFAHREKLRCFASKFVVGVWYFVVLILTSSYVANLSSLLTVAQFNLAKGLHVGYSANSFVRGLIVKDNLNFNDDRLQPYQYPTDYYEALKRGSKNGGVDAIVEEVPYIKALIARYPNEYAMVKSVQRTSGFGFAFRKGSPLVPLMSKAITELREEGKLLEMEKKWFKSRSQLLSQDSELPKLNPLSLEQFIGLFLINGISEFIAILVLVSILLRQRVLRCFNFLKILTTTSFNSLMILVGGTLTSIMRYFYDNRDDRAVDIEAR